MTATFTDTTKNPVVVPVGSTTTTPFTNVSVGEASSFAYENLTVALSPQFGGIGSLSDPAGGGSFDVATHTFTENAYATSTPTPATQILHRLVYTPPTVTNGQGATVLASIAVSGIADPTPVTLDTVSAPAIGGTVANQPVASGATIRPFGSTQIFDYNFYFAATPGATITLTDAGTPSDADGLLTGIGLSKTGVGTYAVSSANGYALQSYLSGLTFTPTAVSAGATRTTGFELNVSDAAGGLATDDKTTSVQVIGPIAAPSPPLIAGNLATQTVAPGNAISPFNAVTVSDANTAPTDSATLTVTGGGTLGGAGLISNGTNVYTVAAATPAALTATLNAISFVAPPLGGQPSVTSTIKLDVVDGQQAASASTAVTEAPPPPAPLPQAAPPGTTSPQGGNFIIADQTTGHQSFASGTAYSGPVQGIADQFILITPDNLNITAHVANSFIHTGAGTDAIDVSGVNGINVLDGGTGSNFLTGGTGADTFFLDDRSPTSDLFSTVVNFHAGDNVTVFGVNPTDFAINTLDNQGAVGARGLDYAFTAAGKPNANVVIAGYAVADLSNGRLTATFGATSDQPGLPGSQYLNIHAN